MIIPGVIAGPPPGPALIDPLGLSPLFWHEAGDYDQGTGDLPDQTANAIDLAQAVAGARPVLTVGPSAFLSFDGVDDVLASTATQAVSAASGVTIAVALAAGTTGTNGSNLYGLGTGAQPRAQITRYDTGRLALTVASAAGTVEAATANNAVPASTDAVVIATLDATELTIAIDDGSPVSVPAGVVSGFSETMTVEINGAFDQQTAKFHGGGVFGTVLSAQDRSDLAAYLASLQARTL